MYDITGDKKYRSLYYFKDVDVLKNKFNIKDEIQLEKLERTITTKRLSELELRPIKGDFDFTHLTKIHKCIFQDIYDWAGEIRNEDIFKGGEFAPSYLLKEALETQIFIPLKNDNYLKNMDINELSFKLAYYMSELNFAHPFREGNGRTQREFIRCLALFNGYDLNWNKIDSDALLKATINATRRYRYDDLSKIIQLSISS
ncbi:MULTISPECIES: Fic/DOC family protein [Clostridium]|uniref:Fic/DOC family protein n=1 Tax=Clostridium TaxID=1485 RepID=UPI0008269558|nr:MULTISPECIES: Fic family protein [Clostridium]PJI10234.1 cell filamentation protein Fic [Clostridium sp. CT7]